MLYIIPQDPIDVQFQYFTAWRVESSDPVTYITLAAQLCDLAATQAHILVVLDLCNHESKS